jgi:Lysyl oxidase
MNGIAVGRLALALAVAVTGATAVVALARGQAPGPGSAPRLPDLVQRAPEGIFVTSPRRGRFHLAFDSRVENHGLGPLEIEAQRLSPGTPRMRARQVVLAEDGSRTVGEVVGRLRYVISPDHSHWHYLDFDRYSLRRLGDGAVGRDRKTGFCLGDRYRAVEAPVVITQPPPGWDVACGADRPRLLRVREGISPGYGDDYPPGLEGQSIDITGLAAGTYRLVHHVNAEGRLAETNDANNFATAIVRIRWPEGRDDFPAAQLVESCEGARRC